MFSSCRKAAIAVGAVVAGFGVLRSASAAPILIENDQSAIVDGWNITAPDGVSLTITSVSSPVVDQSRIEIEKAANFTVPNQSLQIGFQPVAATDPASVIDITNETIFNDTGAPFNGFDFILQNVGSAKAYFGGDVFVNAIGSTPGSLNGAQDFLSYVGAQANGATSSWGGSAGNDLVIVAPAGAVFALDEASTAGGQAVPLPAAAWQSLIGLAGLGIFGLARQRKLRRLA